ncbi:MAG: hydroxylamine reductase [Magnetococcales bacterium]|nr:hydroxylamine reductase [Magnetococcales bacterium]
MSTDKNKITLPMFCNQCGLSAPNGCGSSGQDQGTCGKSDTIARLQDILIFGIKGLAAYREHARELGADTRPVDDIIAETLYFTMTNVNFSFDLHIEQLMKVGRVGVEVMNLLSDAHTQAMGIPTPVKVSQNKAEGHAILVTGHNLTMLQKLLAATEGKGINVYTHSEMLPAHGYPELRRHAHLKGNIGGAWHDQNKLFSAFSGTIIASTNCLAPLKKNANYANRLYGYKITSIEGIKHIENDDFAPLIAQTLELPPVTGFNVEHHITTGHHYKTILTLAPRVVEAVQQGALRQFFVIAGCDSPGSAGDYYRKLAQSLPDDCVILTTSCGKFRFNDLDFGTIGNTGIPRFLDLGQCNDSIGAVHLALALSQALNLPLEQLPVRIVLSWMEQKAVIILLALFSLGIKNIAIGPKPPQFLNDGIFEFLAQNFNLKMIGDVETDLQEMLIKRADKAA